MSSFERDNSTYADGVLDIQAPMLSQPEVLRDPGYDAEVAQQTLTIYQKPSFYIGTVPFSYTTYTMDVLGGGGGPYFRSNIILLHDFGSWKNLYIYNDIGLKLQGVAEGAITLSKSGERVAVAKLSKIEKGEGVEIEEFHLNDRGGVTFYCKSHYRFGGGTKDNEAFAKGKKTAEYFLYWPVSSHG